MTDIDLRDVEKIIEKKEKERTTFNEAARNFYHQDEAETMRKYAEAHGFVVVAKNATTFERPLPCVRDEHGEIREQSIYRLWGKVDEELGEVKAEILSHMPPATTASYAFTQCKKDARMDAQMRVAEEIADTITALTTLADALGIDAEARDGAQRRVNSKNRERGRL